MNYREWAAAVERLCVLRAKKSITMIPELTTKDMEAGYMEGATPEEFYECDVHDALEMQQWKQQERGNN